MSRYLFLAAVGLLTIGPVATAQEPLWGGESAFPGVLDGYAWPAYPYTGPPAYAPPMQPDIPMSGYQPPTNRPRDAYLPPEQPAVSLPGYYYPPSQPNAPPPAGLPFAEPIPLPPLPQIPLPPEEEPLLVVPAKKAKPKLPKKLWSGGIEFGMDGSEGNTQTLDTLFGIEAKRKSDAHVFDFDLDYQRKTADSIETANRAFLDVRDELQFAESRWTCFVHSTLTFDEFQAYDMRVTADSGVGYRFIENDATNLTARFGGGFSREINGPDDRYVPELAYGLDFDHQFSDGQKVAVEAEYAPDVSSINDFRLTTKASWESLLSEKMNLSLRLSILDRYDSTPNGKRPNDFDYTATLLWGF